MCMLEISLLCKDFCVMQETKSGSDTLLNILY